MPTAEEQPVMQAQTQARGLEIVRWMQTAGVPTVVIDLEPGDMTLYRIQLTAPHAEHRRLASDLVDRPKLGLSYDTHRWTATWFGHSGHGGRTFTWNGDHVPRELLAEWWDLENRWTLDVLSSFICGVCDGIAELAAAGR